MKNDRHSVRHALLLAGVLALVGCADHDHADGKDHGHVHGKEAAHAHAAESGHGAEPEKITHFTDRTELFVEFPRLTVGETSAFAAHITHLKDFSPLRAGKVTVLLAGGDQPEESFVAESPTQPGIFRPEASPRHAGERELTIEIATTEFTVRHLLGPVTVYADRKAAESAPAEAHAEGDIGFTKEQQWKVDFAVAEASARQIRHGIAVTGVLKARPDGEALLTAQAAGQVHPAGAFPHVGRSVQKGTVLAHLVPRLGGDTDYASLQAAARRAKVELDQSMRERTRLEGLFRDEAIPEKRVLAARAAEESARIEYEASQRRLGQFGGGGGGIPIRAPIAGAVADVRVSSGAYVQEGQLLFHIADARTMWLELRVPESDAARVSAPSGATFQVEGIDQSFEVVTGKNARLIGAGALVDSTTRTVPVLFEIATPHPGLRIGMAVKARIFVGDTQPGLAVPSEAVVDESGVAVVFVQTGGESFQRRPVRTGARDGDWIQILDGLEPGQRVVTRGAYLVKLAATKTGEIGHGHAH
jgi:membrane fusion protein, heavy metal efflux system